MSSESTQREDHLCHHSLCGVATRWQQRPLGRPPEDRVGAGTRSSNLQRGLVTKTRDLKEKVWVSYTVTFDTDVKL